MLGNLLDNACKYGKGQVLVSVMPRATSGVEIWVEDNGPGIPKALRDEILQRGHRIDTTRPGQGIGLAVTLDIAKACNGSLAIEHSQLGGAKFILYLDR